MWLIYVVGLTTSPFSPWLGGSHQCCTLLSLEENLQSRVWNYNFFEKGFSISKPLDLVSQVFVVVLSPKILNLLVLLIKNWPSDPLVGFEAQGGPSKDVDQFVEAEEEILDLLDAKFPNEVESYVEECVQSWDMFPWFVIMFSSFHTWNLLGFD